MRTLAADYSICKHECMFMSAVSFALLVSAFVAPFFDSRVRHVRQLCTISSRYRFVQSMYRKCGLPTSRFACHSSPYRTALDNRSSFIRTTWPVQVSCRLRCIASMLGISARCSTSLLVTRSDHLIPRMARKWRRCICDN